MNTKILISELGGRLGLDGLDFNHEGVCRLVFDENLVIDLETVGDESLNIYSAVCRVPDGKRESLYELLLAANMTGKISGNGFFAVDFSTQEVLLQTSYHAYDADVQRFVDMLESFLNDVEHWRTAVSGLLQSGSKAISEVPHSAPLMRV